MSIFRTFEQKALRLLLESKPGSGLATAVIADGELVSYEYSGVGYFLTVRHASLPEKRAVYSDPWIAGRAGEVECQYLVFVENGELMLECAPVPPDSVPEGFRDMDVEIFTREVKRNVT